MNAAMRAWSGIRRHALRSAAVTGFLLILLSPATVTVAASPHKARHAVKPRHATVCHLTRRRAGKKRKRICQRVNKRTSALKQKSRSRSTGAQGEPSSPSMPTSSNGSTPASPGGTPTTPSAGTPISAETPTTPITPIPPVGPSRVQVTAEDTEGFHFVLSRHEVPAGKVIIEFIDHGQDEHNLNSRTGAGSSITPISPDLRSGELKDEEFNFAPGSYTLFCSLPEHEAKGMKATLTVD
jgi:plastocyanin